MIYKLIGKAVVKIAAILINRPSGRKLTLRAGVAVVAIGIGVYVAARQVEEG